MTLRKSTLVFVILAVALVVGARRQWQLQQWRQRAATIVAQTQEQEARLAGRRAELATLREKIAAEKRRATAAVTEVARAKHELATVDPASRWTEPPTAMPAWDAAAPYVWLRKDLLPRFGLRMFADGQGLLPAAASVLAVDDATRQALNTQINQLTADYQALEASRAKLVDQALPGTQGDGLTVTVQIPAMPEEGAQVKAQFEAVLNAELGYQRAGLVLQSAESWLASEFSDFGAEVKTISVQRHPAGEINISIKSGMSWFSTGMPAGHPEWAERYIPAHLRAFFKEVLSTPGSSVSAAAGAP
jgi:hypothetical protein